MNGTFFGRQKRVSDSLCERGISAAVIRDFEGNRNSSIRYLTGHPQDALLFLMHDGRSILVPWDMNLAGKCAECSLIIPYTDFDRNFLKCVKSVVSGEMKKPRSAASRFMIDFSSSMRWTEIESLKKELPGADIVCSESGIDSLISGLRIVKDSSELGLIRKAAAITDKIITEIEKRATGRSREVITEAEIALLIEKLARENSADGTGFETIAAGPSRSMEIHPYPSFSGNKATGAGISGFAIVDFGVRFSGYTSDVTLTIASPPLSETQEKMLKIVTDAVVLAEQHLVPGETASAPAGAVNRFLASAGFSMPHSLGHGIGLDVHEPPFLKSGSGGEAVLEKGMVLAVEPGIYIAGEGGVRLENNYIITESGFEKITSSRIIRISA